MVRKFYCLAGLLAMLCANASWAFGYDISGTVADSMYYGKALGLYDVSLPTEGGQYVKIDSCVCADDGHFRFAGEYDLENLAVIGAVYDIPGGVRTDFIGTLVLDDGETLMDMPVRVPIAGESRANNGLRKMIVEINNCLKARQSNGISIEQVKAQAADVCRNTLTDNADNAAGRHALYFLNNFVDEKEWYDIYKASAPYLQRHAPAAELARRVELVLNTEVGRPYIDLRGLDSASNAIALSDVVGNGRPTIVDFWASWCSPCMEEIKTTIKPLYDKYGRDGQINIVGVGVNDKPERLLDAIARLGIEWPQIMDLPESPTQTYGFSSIPFVIVIGADGQILARGVRGDALTALVDSLLAPAAE